MKRPISAVLVAGLLLCVPAAEAQDPFSSGGAGSESRPDKDDSTPAYLKALELQRKGKWKEAQKAFQGVMKTYPNSVHAEDCELRGGENCYLGCVKLHESGPPSRRLDVAVMGDGFQIDAGQQKQAEDWAKLCVDVLASEYAFAEYRDYFNYYFVRLVSKDEGVDQVLSDEELKKREEKAKQQSAQKRKKANPTDFKTALDCKAAGPQKQVMSDHELVYTWLSYANREVQGCGDDGLVIAFAKFGVLGMAELGNGLANCGKPTNSVTVHEFGHAFAGLLDEYANQPGPPTFPLRGPNATTDPKDLPWQHFVDKKVKGVPAGGVEGGATYVKGVWRPGPVCAMNSAGASGGYCPVCREATILRIYATVSPIDTVNQDPLTEMRCTEGDGAEIVVKPMQPRTHDLVCEWYVDRVPDSEPGPKRVAGSETSDGLKASADGSRGSSVRAFGRDGAFYETPPLGLLSAHGVVVKSKTEGVKFVFPLAKLQRGRWQVTCRVWDPTDQVIKDPQHLLEERETFFVRVAPKK